MLSCSKYASHVVAHMVSAKIECLDLGLCKRESKVARCLGFLPCRVSE